MTDRSKRGKDDSDTNIGQLLQQAIERATTNCKQKPGAILFSLEGNGGGTWRVESDGKTASLATGRQMMSTLIEITGRAEQVRAILAHEKDAREAFLDGGLRVRGDLLYLEQLLGDLGMLRGGR